MVPLPNYRPKQLSLGPLEREILEIIWELNSVTVKDVHDRILSNPDRELAYTSVTTVLNRLVQKGWLSCDKQNRSFIWYPIVTQSQAKAIWSYEKLNQFLSISSPEIVAGFADILDQASIEQIEAIAQKLQDFRQNRQKQ